MTTPVPMSLEHIHVLTQRKMIYVHDTGYVYNQMA